MIDPSKIPDNFRHPLSSWNTKTELPNGETENTANLWAFASMITWSCFLQDPGAIALALEAIEAGGECDNPFPLLSLVAQGNQVAIDHCITFIQGGMEVKFKEAFSENEQGY